MTLSQNEDTYFYFMPEKPHCFSGFWASIRLRAAKSQAWAEARKDWLRTRIRRKIEDVAGQAPRPQPAASAADLAALSASVRAEAGGACQAARFAH